MSGNIFAVDPNEESISRMNVDQRAKRTSGRTWRSGRQSALVWKPCAVSTCRPPRCEGRVRRQTGGGGQGGGRRIQEVWAPVV